MKPTIYKAAVLLFLAALIGVVFWFGWARYVEYASRKALHAVGQHAHEITTVEVLRLDGNSKSGAAGSYFLRYDNSHNAITARTILTGAQASEIVRLWERVLLTDSYAAGCHEPGFVLRFIAGKRVIFEGAVCFDCENVSYEPVPFEAACIQMVPNKIDSKSELTELKNFLTNLR